MSQRLLARMGIVSDDRLRKAARVTGLAFLLVGLLGFVPGVTTNYRAMTLAGHTSGALLLGVFAVSVLHNLVHVVFGVAGLALSKRSASARSYLVGGGLVYVLLWLYGVVVDRGSSANFIPLNAADDWLHLVLGVGMVVVGVALGRRHTPGLVNR